MFFIAGYIRAQQDTDLIGFELSVVVGVFSAISRRFVLGQFGWTAFRCQLPCQLS